VDGAHMRGVVSFAGVSASAVRAAFGRLLGAAAVVVVMAPGIIAAQ